jgi:hypothetical protein
MRPHGYFVAVLFLYPTGAAVAQSVPLATSPAATASGIAPIVPRGTPIRVSISEELDGYRDLAGAKIHFTVLEAVYADGKMIVDKGDVGEGVIQVGGHGPLKISVDKVYTYCGDTLDMLLDYSAPDRRRALAPNAPSQIHKGTEFRPVTLRLQRVCNTR